MLSLSLASRSLCLVPAVFRASPAHLPGGFRVATVAILLVLSWMLAPAAAQTSGQALAGKESAPPVLQDPGLREKRSAPQLSTELRPDQRGDIFMARKVYRSAVDSYQEALAEVTAERAEVLRLSAASLRELKRESEARSAESTARDLDRKSKDFASKQKMLPGSGQNFFTRLLAALGIVSNSPPGPAKSDPQSAAAVYRPPTSVEMPEGLSLREQADFLASHGQHESAAALYQSLDQQLLRRQAVLWNKKGIAFHQMLDMDAASRCYRESLRTDARYAEARNNLGTVHYTQKQYSRAVGEYKKSLELTPNSASVHSNLGTAYFAQKRYEEASTHYAKAVEIDPMIFEHRGSQGTILQQRNVEDRASFHFYLSKIYARNGDIERSLLYMRRALEEGFKDRRKFREDQDFAALQGLEEFQILLATEFRVL